MACTSLAAEEREREREKMVVEADAGGRGRGRGQCRGGGAEADAAEAKRRPMWTEARPRPMREAKCAHLIGRGVCWPHHTLLSFALEPLLVFLLPLLNPITRSPFAAAFRSFFVYLDTIAVTIAAPIPRVLTSTHFDCTALLGRRWGTVASHLISLLLFVFAAVVLGRPAFSFSADADWQRCRSILANFALITIFYNSRADAEARTNVKGILHLLSLMLVSDVLRLVFFVHFFLCIIYRLGLAISAYHVLIERRAATVAAVDVGEGD